MAQQNLVFFLPSDDRILCIIVHFTQRDPEMAEKTSNHQLLKPQKIKEYNDSWMTDFLWQRREDDVDTAKSSIPT